MIPYVSLSKFRLRQYLGLIGLLLLPQILFAHSPELHQFQLVSFKKPFLAPSFSLEGLSGKSVKLEDFRGQHVLLNFWATWCIPCLKEMPSMEQLYHHFQDKKFTVVAVSLDVEGKEKVQGFVKKLKLTFPILLDPKNMVSKIYGAKDLPSTFLLNPEGKVIAAAKGERDWFSKEALSYLTELLDESSIKSADAN